MEKNKIIKSMTGVVVSDKMDKSVVVAVEYKVMHPLYKKYVKQTRKFKAHDQNNDCKEGDSVIIESIKPMSKEKTWVIKEIISRAK